jgi:uncharacterized protein (TIGR00369 family)
MDDQVPIPHDVTLLELLAAGNLPLEEAFLQAEVEARLGMVLVSATAEAVIVRMPVGPAAFNSSGNLHGGAVATLVDVSAGTMAALGSGFRPGVETIVTADLHVRYLGRAKGDSVTAESRVLRAGRMLVVVECTVLDSLGNLIAVADFSSMRVPLRGPLRPGGSPSSTAPDL